MQHAFYVTDHDIPLFVRPGSVIAIGSREDRPDYDYGNGAELRVYGLKEGETAPIRYVWSLRPQERM